MKLPWQDKTRSARAIAIFAILLLVSLGLCGANFALFSKFGAISGGTPPPNRPVWASNTLMITGFFELIGMLVGAVGLLVTLFAILIMWLSNLWHPPTPKDS